MKCACLCEEVMRITAVTNVAVRDAFQVTSWDLNRGVYTLVVKIKL